MPIYKKRNFSLSKTMMTNCPGLTKTEKFLGTWDSLSAKIGTFPGNLGWFITISIIKAK